MLEVMAALIRRDNRFLICRRPMQKIRGGLWEFPGGKLEPGETREACLRRECREELDIGLTVGTLFMDVIYAYSDLTVHLSVFNSEIVDGEPKLLEHSEIKWVSSSEFDKYNFCPADTAVLLKLRGY